MRHSFFFPLKVVGFRIWIALKLFVNSILYFSLLFWKCFKSVDSVIQINFAIIHWMNIETSFNKKFLFIVIALLKWTFNHLILWWLWIYKFLNNLRYFHTAITFINVHRLIFKHFTKIQEIMSGYVFLDQNIFFCG